MTKRPGMDDTQRALIGRDRRVTPVRGSPTIDDTGSFEQEDHFTPISEIIERAPDLSERERNLLRYVWTHTANMEMRGRKRSDSQDSAQLRREIDSIRRETDSLQLAVVDIHGESGTNGKVGKINERLDTLKDRLDKIDSRRWQVTMWLAGLLVTVVTSAIVFGKWMGSVETDVETLKARSYRAQRNVSPPDYPATKESPP